MSPSIQLLKCLLLKDFPSGSAIEFYNERFYLIGDDATSILLLDKNYKVINSIKLFDYPDKRIPKSTKTDFETSTLVNVNGEIHLMVLGSASREKRKVVMLIPLLCLDQQKPYLISYYTGEFVTRILACGINEVNIEGATVIGNYMILANRGNYSNQKNHLIITDNCFWDNQNETSIYISELLPFIDNRKFIGISELYYSKSNNILFFTFSSESTNNTYEDGKIGDSYIGWISAIENKIHNPLWKLDGLINLSNVSDQFKNEKIEGICIETVEGNELLLHLVSDNDLGESKLFKIQLKL